MTKKIKNAPGWLGLSHDRTSFVYIPERAEIVRRIFALSIAGLGGYTIAKLLNAKNIPSFGTSNRWDQSTIHNMLSSRATLGEYQQKQTIDNKECAVGDPVPGYYPAIISEALFQAAQEARRDNLASGRGRKGRFITNLFDGLTTCSYCGSPVWFRSNGNDKSMICSAILSGRNCYRFCWSYSDFENTFFECTLGTRRYPQFSDLLAELRESLKKNSESDIFNARAGILYFLRTSVRRLMVTAAGASPPATASSRIDSSTYQRRFVKTGCRIPRHVAGNWKMASARNIQKDQNAFAKRAD